MTVAVPTVVGGVFVVGKVVSGVAAAAETILGSTIVMTLGAYGSTSAPATLSCSAACIGGSKAISAIGLWINASVSAAGIGSSAGIFIALPTTLVVKLTTGSVIICKLFHSLRSRTKVSMLGYE